MRWYSRLTVAALLFVPAAAGAQNRSPIPDHWMTLETLSSQLSLSDEQRAAVAEQYGALNAALQQAYNRREELRAAHSGTQRVNQMSDAQRQSLRDQLEAVRVEYAGRQGEVDQLLASIRALLTPDQQARFDALDKPRVLPATQQQSVQPASPRVHTTAPPR